MTSLKTVVPNCRYGFSRLANPSRKHPGYKRALTLLNEIYRREKLPQRVAVLQSAAWLIDILEKLANSL